MKTKFIKVLILSLVYGASFSQNNISIQKSDLDKILVEFSIPYKDDYITFKKLKTADEYFYSANTRTKRLKSELDSTTIYIAIKEYQSSIKLNQKHWASYRNLSRLFVLINRKDLALISLEKALEYCGKEDRYSLFKMKNEILNSMN